MSVGVTVGVAVAAPGVDVTVTVGVLVTGPGVLVTVGVFVTVGVLVLVGGGAKVTYDILLYKSFRKLKAPEEPRR